ncbi:chloride channel protein [Occultella gossypii]|uniref:Chloride channel protein n=1 Tax=Occultella gossypii TaxID=2800820 RepID=A0ABS7S708_9MICO|nr:chloride channel protein [Occultella gossypii]MBZ2195867.1 chloride channel protein [Occultella gossypii]
MHAPNAQDGPSAPTLPSLHSRRYLEILLMAAAVGVPISAVAWGYMQLVHRLQHWVYEDLPAAVGFGQTPIWWPVAPMVLAGLLVGLTVRYLPGRGGDSPADGFHAGPPPPLRELPGIVLATVASLGLGAVVGPEAPLIALGAGLAARAPEAFRRGHDVQAVAVVGAAGSFAAISLLLGSPLLGAFLVMEAAAVGGTVLGLMMLPGLLAAGIGALVIIGLGSLTGLGTASLAIPGLPEYVRPDVVQFGWAVGIGLMAPFLGLAIQRLARVVRDRVGSRPVLGTSVVGLAIAGLAIAYAALTGEAPTAVLFSGELALGPLLLQAADYSVLTLVLLMVFKGLAYALSLGAFRGGPVFPGMFLGAAGGVALSHLPGLPTVAGAAMGIAAMCVVMLRMPLVSVLLATLLLSQGLALMPLVIVAVVVAHVLTAYLARAGTAAGPAAPGAVGRTQVQPS